MAELKSFEDDEQGKEQAAETDKITKFNSSLQELKDLCSHLHAAATYCETTFLNPKTDKEKVVENTKEYICRAVVTVVDHLGSVSSALECRLSQSNTVAEAELRINSLNQRLFTWQQYSHKLCLTSHSWNAQFPKHYSRYMIPPNGAVQGTNTFLREKDGCEKMKFSTDEEMPLFLYTYNFKPCLVIKEEEESKSGEAAAGEEKRSNTVSPPGIKDGLAVLPVWSGLLTSPRTQHTKFQFQEAPKLKKSLLSKGMVLPRKGFMSLVRRGKRALT